jgi:hypothetical protein
MSLAGKKTPGADRNFEKKGDCPLFLFLGLRRAQSEGSPIPSQVEGEDLLPAATPPRTNKVSTPMNDAKDCGAVFEDLVD